MLLMNNPSTGDPGLNPVVLVLFIICATLIVACLVWAFLLNRKNSKTNQTINTVTEEDELIETTIVEEIEDLNPDNKEEI